MELRTLRTFVEVATTESVTAASATLRITQPALSRQIQQLERELGLQLFERRKSRLHLTAAGGQFLPAALEVLERSGAALDVAESLAAGHLTRLRLAAPTTTLTDVLAPFLATMGGDDPVTTVTESHTDRAIGSLGVEVDMAILTSPPPRSWESLALATLPIWAYVPARHRWSSRPEVTLAELVEEPLVVLDTSLRPRQVLDTALARRGLGLGASTECGNAQVAQALAAAGRGAAVVSDDPRFDLRQLRVIDDGGEELVIDLHAAWSRNHHASAAIASIALRLQEFCIARYGARAAPRSG